VTCSTLSEEEQAPCCARLEGRWVHWDILTEVTPRAGVFAEVTTSFEVAVRRRSVADLGGSEPLQFAYLAEVSPYRCLPAG
jgi:hypothetical protein